MLSPASTTYIPTHSVSSLDTDGQPTAPHAATPARPLHLDESKHHQQTRGHRNTASRGDPVIYVGGNCSDGGGGNRDTDSNSNSNHENAVRAWNSGSLLVRAGDEAPTGRVPRMTYIYLVGNARAGDGVEVEVLVGDEKASTVLSKSSGVTCARVPAREVYTVNILSGDGKTAVLFWTSPSGDGDQVGAFCFLHLL